MNSQSSQSFSSRFRENIYLKKNKAEAVRSFKTRLIHIMSSKPVKQTDKYRKLSRKTPEVDFGLLYTHTDTHTNFVLKNIIWAVVVN